MPQELSELPIQLDRQNAPQLIELYNLPSKDTIDRRDAPQPAPETLAPRRTFGATSNASSRPFPRVIANKDLSEDLIELCNIVTKACEHTTAVEGICWACLEQTVGPGEARKSDRVLSSTTPAKAPSPSPRR